MRAALPARPVLACLLLILGAGAVRADPVPYRVDGLPRGETLSIRAEPDPSVHSRLRPSHRDDLCALLRRKDIPLHVHARVHCIGGRLQRVAKCASARGPGEGGDAFRVHAHTGWEGVEKREGVGGR